jgi:hypothetical protein
MIPKKFEKYRHRILEIDDDINSYNYKMVERLINTYEFEDMYECHIELFDTYKGVFMGEHDSYGGYNNFILFRTEADKSFFILKFG